MVAIRTTQPRRSSTTSIPAPAGVVGGELGREQHHVTRGGARGLVGQGGTGRWDHGWVVDELERQRRTGLPIPDRAGPAQVTHHGFVALGIDHAVGLVRVGQRLAEQLAVEDAEADRVAGVQRAGGEGEERRVHTGQAPAVRTRSRRLLDLGEIRAVRRLQFTLGLAWVDGEHVDDPRAAGSGVDLVSRRRVGAADDPGQRDASGERGAGARLEQIRVAERQSGDVAGSGRGVSARAGVAMQGRRGDRDQGGGSGEGGASTTGESWAAILWGFGGIFPLHGLASQ